MNEREIDSDKIRAEHLAEINVPAVWFYLFGVLVLGICAMLGLIAVMDALS